MSMGWWVRGWGGDALSEVLTGCRGRLELFIHSVGALSNLSTLRKSVKVRSSVF